MRTVVVFVRDSDGNIITNESFKGKNLTVVNTADGLLIVSEHGENRSSQDKTIAVFNAQTWVYWMKGSYSAEKVVTVDEVVEYLKRVNAVDFESGKNILQIGKALGLAKITIRKGLSELRERGLVHSEQQGKQIRYFLSDEK